jgi:type I restriction enzyme, S subunit
MERHDSYKPSGIAWIGYVPAHWDVKPGFTCFDENKDRNKNLNEKTVLSLSYGRIVVKPEEKMTGLVPESFDTYQLIKVGDIVIRTTDLQNDKTSLRVGLAKDKGMITSAYLGLRCKPEVHPEYVFRLLESYDALKVFYGMGSGLRQNIDFWDFKRLPLPLPPRAEQDSIVKFLDRKTAEIDTAIAKKERLIELLQEQKEILITAAVTQGLNPEAPMKKCDIDGIPRIPSHWQLVANRRIFREKAKKYRGESLQPLSLSQKSGLVPTDEMEERSLKTSSFEHFRICRKDDLVLNRFKAHLGVFFAAKQDGVITFHYGIYTPEPNVSSKYYEILFHTRAYCGIYAGASNGMTVGLQNLSNQGFYDIQSIRPPHEEQLAIVKEIELLEVKYQMLIASIKKECDELSDLKKVTIAAAVLGKLKVSSVNC